MKMKMLVMDVDGTLTDGKIYMSATGEAFKAFNIKDGYTIYTLDKIGIIPVIITGRESQIVARRAEELKIKEIHQGVGNKLAKLQEVAARHGVSMDEIAYIGDDYNDVAFNIVRDGVVGNLNSGSGYEKTAASIALRAVLGKISTMPKPSFIVLDEVLGGVAEENYDNIKKLYDRILPDYSFIFHICHTNFMEDSYDGEVIVKKTENISRVLAQNA